MSNFFKRIFPALFTDPAEEALARRMRINNALRKFELEVRKQDGYIRQYLQQATVHKRTGDNASYAQAKKMLAFSFTYRKRAQHSLNSLRLFSTMSDQMQAYRDFCCAVTDISASIGGAISQRDVVNAQMQLQKGMETAKSTEVLMDQMLSAFDSSFSGIEPGQMENTGIKDDDLEEIIAAMSDKRDSLTEDTITEILNRVKN